MPDVSFEEYRSTLNKLEEEEILKAWRKEKAEINLIFLEEMRKSLDAYRPATFETQKAKRW